MTTPEQPGAPALTRKQMREIRNTGANPIITMDSASEPEPDPAPTPAPEPAPPVAHLARAAEPIVVPEAPMPDAAVDLGVSPLTRRQARQQELIRTASVPVITPEVAAAHTAAYSPAAASVSASVAAGALQTSGSGSGSPMRSSWADSAAEAEPAADDQSDAVGELFSPVFEQPAPEAEVELEPEAESERAVVNPLFGVGLFHDASTEVEPPASFDQLLGRSSSGAVGTPNALIVSQNSSPSPMVAAVTATGEVMVTGTLNLPEGLGSNGHAPGAADGKDVDAVLIDGEIPAHSSPTPIAASAAISTVKNSGEIITPPTPEKGNKLMMSLAITAGALALALVGVLILAFVTGVF